MTVSEELRGFYESKLKEKKIKCVYIPHCVDVYPEVTSNLTQNNILSVGRLAKEKGYTDLIEIFKEFNKKMPNWNLNICGDGQEYNSIEEKIKESQLEEKAKLLGFKNKEELHERFLDSSIYVMTSYTESFGLVLIDAESYGLPLVAFDSARGATEIIEDGVNGYLIKNREKEKMVETLVMLAEEYELRQKLGNVGRKKSEIYKKENISKKWFEFLENIRGEKFEDN